MTVANHKNGPFVAFDQSEIQQSIPARFEQKVFEHGSRVAVKMNGYCLNYSELNSASNNIGHRLLDVSNRKHEPVAILMAQGIPLLAAILGVLKAGKIYVPIDTTFPATTIASVLREARIDIVLTDDVNMNKASSAAGRIRNVTNVQSSFQDTQIGNLDLDLSPRDPAYVFFTSGSTGSAKGVVDSHRNVLHNIMRYTNNLRIDCDDRITLLQSSAFSGSVSSLFGALLNGASIYPFDLRRNGIGQLADLLVDEGITIYHSVPAIFEQLLLAGRHFEQLRVIRLEGDRCANRHVELFQRHFRHDCILANGLGATETGLSHQYLINLDTVIDGSVVPVGYPTEDFQAIILDNDGCETPRGQRGEIAVESEYLATGYWRDSEQTDRAFEVVAGTDKRLFRSGDLGRIDGRGRLEHLGRKEFQVRIRGQTVNLEALECALAELPGVTQAVVHGHVTWADHQQLVAYIVLSDSREANTAPNATNLTNNQDLNETWLRKELAKLFPAYMIPARFVQLAEMPLDSNGKISRRELRPPDKRRPALKQEFVAPHSDTEKCIAKIWREILNLEQVGLHDDFFELGGDSMFAMMLPMLVEERTGVTLSDATLLEARTISEFAKRIDNSNISRCLVAIQPNGSKRPFFCVHAHTGRVLQYRDLAELLGENQPFYALQPSGYDGKTPLLSTIEEMAAHYIKEIKEIQPNGPYCIGGYCLGGLVAYEIARQLRNDERRNDLIVLIDTEYPRGKLLRRISPRRYVHQISQTPYGKRTAYTFSKAKNIVNRIARIVSTRFAVLIDGAQGVEIKQGFPLGSEPSMIQTAIAAAQKRYKPKSYNGDVTLICVKSTEVYDPGTFSGWNTLVNGELQIIDLPVLNANNDYEHLFHEPYLTLLSDELRKVLGLGTRERNLNENSDTAN